LANLTAGGRAHFVAAMAAGLTGPYEVTFIPQGGGRCGPYPVDRVVANDPDKANSGRGEWVVSFRVVVPAGANIPGPATTAELWHAGGIIYKTSIQPFRPSLHNPSIIYLNFALGGG
jgi:hypothetical protein